MAEAVAATIECIGCGARVPDTDGPVHSYLGASPGCWAYYGELISAESLDRNLAPMQRLTINTYAVQHPGVPRPQTKQSLWVHLAGLCLVLERGQPADRTMQLMAGLASRRWDWDWLEPPALPYPRTIVDVRGARTLDSYDQAVAEWSVSTWLSWQAHHDAVRAVVDQLLAD
jgi:uncharacterized protein DUF5946